MKWLAVLMKKELFEVWWINFSFTLKILPGALNCEAKSFVKMGNSTNFTYFYLLWDTQLLSFEAPLIIQVFHNSIHQTAKRPCFFCSFCKVPSLYLLGKMIWELTVIWTSTQFRSNIFHIKESLFCEFLHLNFPIDKNCQLDEFFYLRDQFKLQSIT